MHPLIIFDDGQATLGPMTDLRAVFEVRTGMLRTCERLAHAFGVDAAAGYWTPPHLAPLVAERAGAPVNRLPGGESFLLANGRWMLAGCGGGSGGRPDASQQLHVGEALIEAESEDVILAHLSRSDAERFLQTRELPDALRTHVHPERVLIQYPWDVIAWMKQALPRDILATRLPGARLVSDSATIVGHHPIDVDRTAKIYPNVTLDAEHGPILIDAGAVIRPGCVLVGPCAVLADSTIIDRAFIKANTVIGPQCKIAGEVGGTIFQGCSNKAHDGHLGDCWVGKWVNFGAGTTNSNLLNTYGEVTMRLEHDGPRLRTGLQFLGAIVGDHAKFAICTRIMTGSVIGTGAMIATTQPPPTTVKRFAWLTDGPQGERSFRLDKFLDIAKTVMERRKVTPSAAYVKTVGALHANSVTRE